MVRPEELAQALDRTFADGGVRVEFRPVVRFSETPLGLKRRRGGLLRPLMRAGAAGVERLSARLFSEPNRGQGFVDVAGHRSVLSFGSSVVMVIGDRSWAGRVGEDVARRPTHHAGTFEPLWLFELLRGAVDVQPGEGGELLAHCDLTAVAAAAAFDMPVPNVHRYSELRRLPLYVRLDADGHIKSLRCEVEMTTLNVEVLERGVEGPADWTRLPDVLDA